MKGMALAKHGLTVIALVVTLYILETQDLTEISSLVSLVGSPHLLDHEQHKIWDSCVIVLASLFGCITHDCCCLDSAAL